MRYSTNFFPTGNFYPRNMHELINKLAFSLFRKNNLEQCSIDEIEHLARQYPYLSSAQLLLAAKQKQTDHSDFEKTINSNFALCK